MPEETRKEQRGPADPVTFRAILAQYRDRRERRTRLALHWSESRAYGGVLFLVGLELASGSHLLSNEAVWQKAAGVLLLLVGAAFAIALIRWLLLPVDEASR